MKKLNIGILSDSCFFTTGYSTIATRIANLLSERGHNVTYFAHGYIGQPVLPGTTFEDGMKLNFSIIGGGREGYFKDVLPVYTKQLNLDVMLVLFDTFMLFPWFLDWDLSPAKVIFYYPSDGGGGMPLGCERILQKAHKAVAMSKFGQKQVNDMYKIITDYIPHAVDTSLYYPLSKEQKEELKRKNGLSGKFIVGSVFRNQGRKMADRTIKAFALFAKNNPDAILFLHTDPYDNAQVFDIGQLIARYQLQNRVIFSGMRFFKGFTYKQMNEVYNLMDVFILTTSGEGFGIPIIEAQAAGIPVLATDYTTIRELVVEPKTGLGIPLVGVEESNNPAVHELEILDGTITGSWNVERGICNVVKCAEALQLMHDNPKMLEEMGKNGRMNALENYDWNKIGKQWIDYVEKLGGNI
jgi:glycosyltransferase involved in cell wall biosynthesis